MVLKGALLHSLLKESGDYGLSGPPAPTSLLNTTDLQVCHFKFNGTRWNSPFLLFLKRRSTPHAALALVASSGLWFTAYTKLSATASK